MWNVCYSFVHFSSNTSLHRTTCWKENVVKYFGNEHFGVWVNIRIFYRGKNRHMGNMGSEWCSNSLLQDSCHLEGNKKHEWCSLRFLNLYPSPRWGRCYLSCAAISWQITLKHIATLLECRGQKSAEQNLLFTQVIKTWIIVLQYQKPLNLHLWNEHWDT